jgi:hypothetical protein
MPHLNRERDQRCVGRYLVHSAEMAEGSTKPVTTTVTHAGIVSIARYEAFAPLWA